jgi:Amt family ammonium transporter
VAGLVAITPASGFVSPLSSIAIGLVAGLVCYAAVAIIKIKLGYDDSLDAFGIHGVGGTTGALLTGIFAEKLINPAGNNGLLFGNPSQFSIQLVAVVAAAIYAFVGTFLILKVLNLIIGLRVNEEEEVMGLDVTQHKESAYTLID